MLVATATMEAAVTFAANGCSITAGHVLLGGKLIIQAPLLVAERACAAGQCQVWQRGAAAGRVLGRLAAAVSGDGVGLSWLVAAVRGAATAADQGKLFTRPGLIVAGLSWVASYKNLQACSL